MSLIFATQLTAAATAILAVFAIVTAAFAILAFLKQAKEVHDQASMLAYRHRAVTASGSAVAVSAMTLRVQEFDKGRGPVGLPPIG